MTDSITEQGMKNHLTFIRTLMDLKAGFRLGDPWRKSEHSTACLVPIFRDRAFDRDYLMFEEIKVDDYSVEDTGNINQVKFKNLSLRPVFIRAGTMFKGLGTQSRGVESSVIVTPNEDVLVPVKCIHQSHGITPGSGFMYAGVAPSSVTSTLMSNEGQSKVWSSVAYYASSLSSTRSANSSTSSLYYHTGGQDNLSEKVDTMKQSSAIKDLIKEVPPLENQIGLLVFDETGLHAIELFDSSESWVAFHESVITSYGDLLNKQSQEKLFEVKFNAPLILPLFRQYLSKVLSASPQSLVLSLDAVTLKVQVDGGYLESTLLNGRLIHLIGFTQGEKHEK